MGINSGWLVVALTFSLVFVANAISILMKSGLPDVSWDLSSRRIQLGFAGGLLGSLLYSYLDATLMLMTRQQSSHLAKDQSFSWWLTAGLNDFVLMVPFALIGTAVILIPYLVVVSRVRLASLTGVFFGAVLLASYFGVKVYIEPSWRNPACESQVGSCTAKSFFEVLVPLAAVTMGFGLAARLPLLRNDGK